MSPPRAPRAGAGLPVTGNERPDRLQSLESSGIRSIAIYPLNIPLRSDFSISGSTAGYANNVLLSIQTRDGRVGWGEASPVSRVTGETQATCIAKSKLLKATLLGRDSADLGVCTTLMNRTVRGHSTIKSAFDIALHDLAAQRTGLPLWKFLGGKSTRPLPTDATIFLRPLEQVATLAAQLKASGFRSIKIKLGHSSRDDVTRVCTVREIVGPDVELRADANESWPLDYAVRTLPQLDTFGIVFCEQPLPAANRAGLRKLARATNIPLMADESLFSPHHAAALAKEKTFSYFNIKLTKSGGIYRAQKIGRIAGHAAIPCMTGCMNESRLGLTASAHFAAACNAVKFYDLDSFLMQTDDWTIGGARIKHGSIHLPRGNGLGAVPDPHWLKKQKPVA